MESSSASAPDDARPAPEKWKAQRVFRERQRVCASAARIYRVRPSASPQGSRLTYVSAMAATY